MSNQNSLDWNRESWLTYLTFPCELTALTFFFFFFKTCKQNYHINNFCISWLGIKAGDWLYLSLRWIISSETPGTFPGLPWCEPFHSGVFEVCYLSQATKFRPWLPLMWMELCDCLVLDVYFYSPSFHSGSSCWMWPHHHANNPGWGFKYCISCRKRQPSHAIDSVQLSDLWCNLSPV